MTNGVVALASYGSFGGGTLGDLFAQWEAAGIFQYALPFLLIFALVYGLLSKLNIFSDSQKNPNKAINAMIALAVSFMALQFDIVSMFFSEIFPRFGVALSIILVILILGGLFMPTSKENNWFMIALAAIVFIIIGVVIYNSMAVFGWGFGGMGNGGLSYFWGRYGAIVIFVVLVLVVVLVSSGKKRNSPVKFENLLLNSRD